MPVIPDYIQRRLDTTASETVEHVDALFRAALFVWTQDPTEGDILLQKANDEADKIDYPKKKYMNMFFSGLQMWREDVQEALSIFSECLQWFEEHAYSIETGLTHILLGNIYWGFGDFQQGFSHCSTALENLESNPDSIYTGWASHTLATFHYDFNGYTESKKYYQKSLKLFEEQGNFSGQARSLNGIANNLLHMGQVKEAVAYQEKSLELAEKSEDPLVLSRIYNDMGNICKKQGHTEQAFKYYFQSLSMREEIEYPIGTSTTLIDIGNLYLAQKKYSDALKYLNRGLQESEKINAKPKILKALDSLARVYEEMQDPEQSLASLKKLRDVEKAFQKEGEQQRLTMLKASYQVEASNKEAEIYRLKNVELKEQNQKLEQTMQELRSAQSKLIQSEKMAIIGKLTAGIVHEINTPLGVLKSNTDFLKRGIQKVKEWSPTLDLEIQQKPKLSKWFQSVQEHSETNTQAIQRVTQLATNLKTFIHLDEAPMQKIDIHQNIDATIDLLSYRFNKKITLEKTYGNVPNINVNPQEFNQVVMNIILNGLQAMQEGGNLSISTTKDKSCIHIAISDTGIGIPKSSLETIFEPDFTIKRNRVKMSSGLYTSYQIMQNHQGSISVQSELQKGSTFTLSFPNGE